MQQLGKRDRAKFRMLGGPFEVVSRHGLEQMEVFLPSACERCGQLLRRLGLRAGMGAVWIEGVKILSRQHGLQADRKENALGVQ